MSSIEAKFDKTKLLLADLEKSVQECLDIKQSNLAIQTRNRQALTRLNREIVKLTTDIERLLELEP